MLAIIVLLHFVFQLSFQANAAVSNAVVYLPLTQNYSYLDASGNGINGTAMSDRIFFETGPYGFVKTAVALGDEPDSYISVTNTLLDLSNQSWTIAGHVQNLGNEKAPLIEFPSGLAVWFFFYGNELYVNPRSCGQFQVICPSSNSAWRFIAVTYDYDTKTLSLYCDKVVRQAECLNQPRTSMANILLGKRLDSTPDLYPGSVFNGNMACFSVHMSSFNSTELSKLSDECRQFSDSSCANQDGFVVDVDPSFLHAKGHFALAINGEKCFNSSKTHVCSFYDETISSTPRQVLARLNGSSNYAIACVVPYLYTAGRMKVELSSFDDFIIRNSTVMNDTMNSITNSSQISISTWKYVTVGLENPPKVSAVVTVQNENQVEYSLTWNTADFNTSFDLLFPSSYDFSPISDGENVNVDLLSYNGSTWKVFKQFGKYANSGSVTSLTVNLSELDFYLQTSIFTFKISKSVNWTYVEEEMLKTQSNLSVISDLFPNGVFNFSTTDEDSCFQYWFYPDQTFQDACNYANVALFSGNLLPLVSADSSAQQCESYLTDLTSGGQAKEELDCPQTSVQAGADLRFIPNAYSYLFNEYNVVYSGVTIDSLDRSRIAEYNNVTTQSTVSRLVQSPCWSGNSSLFDIYGIDKLPWFHCCSASEYSQNCLALKTALSYKPCSNYKAPGTAHVVGSGHFATFDGLSFTFNAAGEFWLVRSKLTDAYRKFDVQIRLGGSASCTSYLTAVAVKTSTTTVQVEPSRLRYSLLDVYVNGYLLEFDNNNLLRQCFAGFVISSKDSQVSSVILSLSSDVSLEISSRSSNKDALNLELHVGKSQSTELTGLLGNFDAVSSNDLTAADGSILPSTSSDGVVHFDFAMTWNVSSSESLFSYFDGQSYDDYWNPSFIPCLDWNLDDSSQDATDLCGTNEPCLFDYNATGSSTTANETLQFENEAASDDEILQQVVVTCPEIVNITNGYVKFESGGFSQDSVIEFHCLDGYIVAGSSKLTCLSSGQWDDDPPTCQSERCPNITVPANGYIGSQTNDTLIGSEVTFKCNSCYKLIGNLVVQCQSNSTWSSSWPSCIEVICLPVSFSNSINYTLTNGIKCGSVATFHSCDDSTLYLEGASSATCTQSGSWSATIPSCKKPCPSNQHYETIVKPTSTSPDAIHRIGSNISYTCMNTTWKMEGNSVITCRADSTWSSLAPICFPPYCPCSACILQNIDVNSMAMIAIIAVIFNGRAGN